MKAILKKSFSSSFFIKNGHIINPDRSFKGDVLIKNGKILKVIDYSSDKSLSHDYIPPHGHDFKIIDASGKFIIPGGIDTHTHMELPFMGEISVDDFDKGTRAAIAGGTTTILDFFIPNEGESLQKGYEAWRKKADGKTNCDYSLHCILTRWDDDVKDQMKGIIDLGVQSFKVFLAFKGSMMDNSNLYQILKKSKELGALVLVHSENGQLIEEGQKEIYNMGITGPEGHYFSRPDIFEALATHQALTISEYLSSPLYIVHLMSKLSTEELIKVRERGAPVFGETLAATIGTDGRNTFNQNWEIAAGHIMSPPLNPDPSIKEYLMKQLHLGNISTVGSDNCTFCMKMKRRGEEDFRKIPNGVNGVEDRLSILWTMGVKKGMISMSEFVRVSSTNAAQIFNLYPQKGIIKEDSDADIVIWNGNDERVISKHTHNQAVDFNIFEGFIVNGTAEVTFLNGEIVYKNGEFIKENLNKGKFIPRKPYGHVYDRVDELTKSKSALNWKVDRKNENENENKMYKEFDEISKLRGKLSEAVKEIEELKKKREKL